MALQALTALYAVLVFLFPLGVYLLVLAHLNRGPRPVVVPGRWDCAGLLLGLSGFFLYTVPTLLTELYHRSLESPDGLDFDSVWARWWLLWLAYYVLLVGGAAGLLALRRRKTLVYNVDVELFGDCLALAVARAGLTATAHGGRLALRPAEALADKQAPPAAELEVETFPSLAHVTLHWSHAAPEARRDVEAELTRTLENAAAADNPAAAWFLGFSGLIFGLIALLTAFLVLLTLLGRRL